MKHICPAILYGGSVSIGDRVSVNPSVASIVTEKGYSVPFRHDGLTCNIVGAFYDYESGWHYEGEIHDESIVQTLDRIRSDHHHFDKHLHVSYDVSHANGNRKTSVYFSEFDIAA